jgi:hypothetical protein
VAGDHQAVDRSCRSLAHQRAGPSSPVRQVSCRAHRRLTHMAHVDS